MISCFQSFISRNVAVIKKSPAKQMRNAVHRSCGWKECEEIGLWSRPWSCGWHIAGSLMCSSKRFILCVRDLQTVRGSLTSFWNPQRCQRDPLSVTTIFHFNSFRSRGRSLPSSFSFSGKMMNVTFASLCGKTFVKKCWFACNLLSQLTITEGNPEINKRKSKEEVRRPTVIPPYIYYSEKCLLLFSFCFCTLVVAVAPECGMIQHMFRFR